MNIDMDVVAVTSPGALLGEGTTWDPDRGVVWWVDIKGRRLHAHHVATRHNRVQALRTRLTALGLASGSTLVAAGDRGLVRLDFDEGLTLVREVVIAAPQEPAGNRWNDGAVDAAGGFWAGTMDDAELERRGALYRLGRDHVVTKVRSGIMVPNGPAFLSDGTVLFTDTAAGVITALTLGADGLPASERVFARFDATDGYPDGMAVDAEDHVWVAFWDGWSLRRLSPGGRVVATVPMPVQRPTRPVFAGPDLNVLYVTSATIGLGDIPLVTQPHAGALLRLTPGVRGREPHTFLG